MPAQDCQMREPEEGPLPASAQMVNELEPGKIAVKGAIRFGVHVAHAGSRLLLRDGEAVEIGSRAFDLLMALLSSRGSVLTKVDIIRKVWPDTVVDDCNLRFQMTSLRKKLGEDRDLIKTIPGRGYLFADEREAGEVTTFSQVSSLPSDPIGDTSRTSVVAYDHSPTVGKASEESVAVIDDDHSSREALEGLFHSVGLKVETFCSVQAYMDREQASSPGCLVLDVWLPGRSGLDFQADLNRAGKKVPIIFISGHADLHMGVQAMKAGAFEFLTKPVRHKELLEAVRLAIQSGQVSGRHHKPTDNRSLLLAS